MALPRGASQTSFASAEAVSSALEDVLANIQSLRRDQAAQSLSMERLAKQVAGLRVTASTEFEPKPADRAQVSHDASADGLGAGNGASEELGPAYGVKMSPTLEDLDDTQATQDPEVRARRSALRSKTQVVRDEFREFLKEHRNLAQLFESEEEEEIPWYRSVGRMVVENRFFERGVGLVIVVNSVMLGIETELAIQNKPPSWPQDVEYVFMSLYSAELILRLMAYGWSRCCTDGWFLFDAVLVFVAYLGKILPEIMLAMGSEGQEGMMEQIMVVRMLRILRFVRALRVVKQFGTIWKLIRGLLTSFDVMASAVVLVFLMLYIFACLGMELIGGDDELKGMEATSAFATQHFSTVPQAIMTLFQFVTLDSTPAIYVPLVNAKPILGAYFLILLLAVGIIFMNLVTASIVEASLQSSELDRKEKKERLKTEMIKSIPVLMKLFHELDTDKSGKISLDEIEQFDINILPPILRDNISVDNMADLFGVLDVDGGGELDMKEFIGGLLQLWLMDVPITTLQILKFSRMNRQKTMEYFSHILQRMEEMGARIDQLQVDMEKMQLLDSGLFQETSRF